jgi:tetratricopeptide (TPR) repeat protein
MGIAMSEHTSFGWFIRHVRVFRLFLIALFIGWAAPAAPAAEPGPVNLLRLKTTRLERSSFAATARLSAWTDGDPATAAAVPASAEAPFEVVYAFDATVTVEQVRLQLPSGAAAMRLEVLLSSLSPVSGFQLVRQDAVRATTTPQLFRFPPTGARWVLIRLTPTARTTEAALAELELLGRNEPPRSHYAFNESPARAIQVLDGLKKLAVLEVQVTADEQALFKDIKDGRFQTWSLEEAALLASGVTEGKKRKAYLDQFNELAAQARKATAAASTAQARGEQLLRFLHGGPMKKGYSAKQTTLSGILDTGQFNCVSSALLFNALAGKLGLDARGVEVPDHAFSIVYVGTRGLDVETTTPQGFNPSRTREAQERFKGLTGFAYIPEHRRESRREIRDAGLVAILYYNRGVALAREGRHHEALLCYFRALNLDPEFASAVKNALASLANWGVALAKEKKFAEGLEVLSAGLRLAPKDATLLHNRKVFWGQWADSLVEAGKTDEALATLDRAAREVPSEAAAFTGQKSWVFLRKGEALAKQKKWAEALEAVAPGLKKLTGPQKEEIERWQVNLYLRHSSERFRSGQPAEACGVLARAMKFYPKDGRFAGNLCYVVQEWADQVGKKEGEDKARELLLEQVRLYPQVPRLKEVGLGHVHRAVTRLQKAGRHAEALAAIDRYKDLIPSDKERTDLVHIVADRWAKQLRGAGDFAGALDVYDSTLKGRPEDRHLTSNRTFTMQEWVRQSAKTGEEASRKALVTLRKRYPNEKALDGIAQTHVQDVVAGLSGKGKFEEALKAIERSRAILGSTEAARQEGVLSLSCRVYDRWASGLAAKMQWKEAVGVYADGLKKFPKDKHLTNNAVVVWDRWAKTFLSAKDWDGAIGVYKQGLEQFPDSSVLKNNLRYCEAKKN